MLNFFCQYNGELGQLGADHVDKLGALPDIS